MDQRLITVINGCHCSYVLLKAGKSMLGSLISDNALSGSMTQYFDWTIIF